MIFKELQKIGHARIDIYIKKIVNTPGNNKKTARNYFSTK